MPRLTLAALLLFLTAVGCDKAASPAPPKPSGTTAAVEPADPETAAMVAEERAKLTPEDRALVEAQEWCVISTERRLGSMDAPIKLDIKGQPVFICCKGCKRKAEADPDTTLAKVAELKAKKAAPPSP